MSIDRTPHTWATEEATSTLMNAEIKDLWDGLQAAWTSYAPAWTSSGTAPAIGNGTITGAYIRIGKTVHFRVKLAFNTTTTFGTGSWSISLPVAIGASGFGAAAGFCNVTGSSARYAVAGWIDGAQSTTTVFRMTTHGDSPGIGATAPATWTANTANFLILSGTYEAA